MSSVKFFNTLNLLIQDSEIFQSVLLIQQSRTLWSILKMEVPRSTWLTLKNFLIEILFLFNSRFLDVKSKHDIPSNSQPTLGGIVINSLYPHPFLSESHDYSENVRRSWLLENNAFILKELLDKNKSEYA